MSALPNGRKQLRLEDLVSDWAYGWIQTLHRKLTFPSSGLR